MGAYTALQLGRVPAFALENTLKAPEVPVLLMVGDEDESCIDVNLWLKRMMVCARLVVPPGCGHVLNLEESALFNQQVARFLSSVDRGTWRPRDPETLPGKGGCGYGRDRSNILTGRGDNEEPDRIGDSWCCPCARIFLYVIRDVRPVQGGRLQDDQSGADRYCAWGGGAFVRTN